MPRSKAPLAVSADQRQQIQRWLAAHGTPRQVALRCQIVEAACQGRSDAAIASELGINRKTVVLWRDRFAQQGLPSLWQVAPGRGRKRAEMVGPVSHPLGVDLHSAFIAAEPL